MIAATLSGLINPFLRDHAAGDRSALNKALDPDGSNQNRVEYEGHKDIYSRSSQN